jgi:hypothetical protein
LTTGAKARTLFPIIAQHAPQQNQNGLLWHDGVAFEDSNLGQHQSPGGDPELTFRLPLLPFQNLGEPAERDLVALIGPPSMVAIMLLGLMGNPGTC